MNIDNVNIDQVISIKYLGNIGQEAEITQWDTFLTFECENLVLIQKQKSRIQAVEVKHVRRVTRVIKQDRLKNKKIRERLKIEPRIENIEKMIIDLEGHLQLSLVLGSIIKL